MKYLILLSLVLSAVWAAPTPSWGQEALAPLPAIAPIPPPPSLTPVEAQRALDALQDDKKRAELIETLRAIAKAAPGTAPAPSETAPANAPPPTVDPEGLGAELLTRISDCVSEAVEDFGVGAETMTRFPLMWRWIERISTDPASRAKLFEFLWKLAAEAASALLLEWGLMRALRHPRQAALRQPVLQFMPRQH